MTAPHVPVVDEAMAKQTPNSDDWASLGYESKQAAEESFQRIYEMPEVVKAPAPVQFTHERSGSTKLEWGWRGDNVVIHLSWVKAPTAPRDAITDSIVLALNSVLKGSVLAKVKPPTPPLDADGNPIRGTILDGSYTIILAALKLRPGATHVLQKQIVPALLAVNALDPRTLRRIDPAQKRRIR
jgi:hypothetical protein